MEAGTPPAGQVQQIWPDGEARPARTVLAAAGVALLEERRLLDEDELRALANVTDDAIPSLAALAHEVRLACRGPTVDVEGLLSAKTGGCPAGCCFCRESSRLQSPVKPPPSPA